MRERNLGEKRIDFAAKMNPFHLPVGPTCGPTPHPPSLSCGQQPHLLPHSHSRASLLSQPAKAREQELTLPLTSSLLSPSNLRSRSRIKVCMWYHCDHKLTSIPFLQFVCSFLKDLSRFGCLLVLGLKSEEHRSSSICHRFLLLPVVPNLSKAPWVSPIGFPWLGYAFGWSKSEFGARW